MSSSPSPVSTAPEITVLPCQIGKSGKIGRTYPGAPGAVGWTLFVRTATTYVFNGDAIFETERAAIRHLAQKYHLRLRLNRNESLRLSEA
jgi:hypothetical protein